MIKKVKVIKKGRIEFLLIRLTVDGKLTLPRGYQLLEIMEVAE